MKYFQKDCQIFSRCHAFDYFVIIICLTSFACSWIESALNADSLHWGFAYGSLLDLKRGAIPYSETFLGYGYIPALFGIIALNLFGEKIIVIGILTGLFYSFSLFLSYLVFQKFLSKGFAFISVLLIFLIHPYIIYPGGNYVAYAFQLLGLIFFLRYADNRLYGFLAGVFLCMAVLSRYSSVIAILPPFAILLAGELLATQGRRKIIIEKILIMASGFLIPLSLFFTYLFIHSALDDFFFQNKMMIQIWGKVDNVDTYLKFVASILQIVPSFASDFRGKLFTVFLIVCIAVISREIFKNKLNAFNTGENSRYYITAVSLVALFGYLNSIHHYEIFRLVNGSSIGVGVTVFVFSRFYKSMRRPFGYLMASVGILIIMYLSSTLFFKATSSSYYPWRMDILFYNGVKNENIGILKGKILSQEYNDFYQEVYDVIESYKNSYFILNYTNDAVAFLMNDLPRIQVASIFYPWVENPYQQAALIDQQKVLILAGQELHFTGYREIFKKRWPEEIPWLGGNYLFIYAPKRFVDDNNMQFKADY